MRHLLSAFIFLAAFAATAQAQTMKALVYNTNGQVVYGGTNSLSFTNSVSFTSDVFGFSFEAASGSNYTQVTPDGVAFSGSTQKENTRANLGFSTNLNTLWTATNASNARSALGLGATWLTNSNVTNFRAAVGLGETNDVSFNSVAVINAAATRTNLSLGLAALTNTNVTNFRTAIGLPFAALTNTSNVTVMRALAGTTNTNEPFSGVVQYLDHTTNPFYLDVSNGIILRRYE